ncbi:hypothetical protein C8K30_10555 [Promicromonospora sp. AC04]|nr:hypothetical protein C8K30_10555 [Promicromonospora sp. AC04]
MADPAPPRTDRRPECEAATMSTASDVAREIDRVLRQLDGHGLYRNNAFRVTGLSADASARQIRRHQEELRNPYHVPPASDRDVPLPPSDDADAQRAAFEALRDPLARLVHELFWLRPEAANPDSGYLRDQAVFAHCRALEATASDGSVADETAWTDWEVSTNLWSLAFAAEDTWEWVRRRAAEIDDPRLSVAVLRALRERLPEHVIGASVGLAVRAAAVAPSDTELHMDAVEEAGFEARQVREVARAAVEPFTGRVRAACETAQGSDPAAGLSAAQELLDGTAAALTTITAVLGADDDLAGACRDEVAHAANNRVIAYVNEAMETASGPGSVRARPALELLRRARAKAVSESVTTLLDKNIADLEQLAAYVAAGGRGRFDGRGAQRGEPGCVVLLVVFLAGAVGAFWLLGSVLGVGPIWALAGAVFGGFMAVGLVTQVIEFFQDL